MGKQTKTKTKTNTNTSLKQELLMNSISKFFGNTDNLNKMIYIQESTIPLRYFDWFVTNYAKKKNIILNQEDGSDFNIYIKYKSELKGLRKKYFDPFCRGNRIKFCYDKNDSSKIVETTVGQLNFFKWIIKYKVLDYIIDCLDKIQKDIELNEIKKKEKKASNNYKRTSLTPSITKMCYKRFPEGGITIKF